MNIYLKITLIWILMFSFTFLFILIRIKYKESKIANIKKELNIKTIDNLKCKNLLNLRGFFTFKYCDFSYLENGFIIFGFNRFLWIKHYYRPLICYIENNSKLRKAKRYKFLKASGRKTDDGIEITIDTAKIYGINNEIIIYGLPDIDKDIILNNNALQHDV